jgi:phosphatidylinositol glycan class B
LKFSRDQIVYFGLAFHLLAAFFSIGYHQCDELFQVYEFAGYKLGINTAEELPWEFTEQMRSGIQPLIVYCFTKVFHVLSVDNPFTISLFIRVIQSLISFLAIVKLIRLFEKELISEQLKKWLWISGLLFWCLPYFHARFSSENFSATLFIFGLISILNSSNKKLLYLSAGFLMGLAFLARFQLCFMIIGLFGWLFIIRKTSFKNLLLLSAGIILSLGVGLLVDKWLYGQWTLSWWNYLDLNLFKDKASIYGKEPVLFYLGEALVQLIPPISLVIFFCVIFFWIRLNRHVITWITLPFVLLHFFVSHKELRFLFPILNFLPIMVLLGLQSLKDSKNKLWLFIKRPGFVKFAVTINSILLLYFVFKPADSNTHALKTIYELVQGENPVLLYEVNDPYNNNASLNYFRNPELKTCHVDSMHSGDNLYYFAEKFNEPDTLIKNNRKFEKIYSSYPEWFSVLNFNGWLDRDFTFSIYKCTGR